MSNELLITYGGMTQNLTAWEECTGIPRTTIMRRIARGVPLEKCFQKVKKKEITRLDEIEKAWTDPSLELKQISKDFGISAGGLYKLADKYGWPDRVDTAEYRANMPKQRRESGSIDDIPELPRLGMW